MELVILSCFQRVKPLHDRISQTILIARITPTDDLRDAMQRFPDVTSK